MKKYRHTLILSFYLLGTSFILYLINFAIFRDFHHIAIFVTEDLAFIPIEVLVTVVIIESLLGRRDRKKKKQKINILLEVFFEEVGNELLCKLAANDKNCCEFECFTFDIGKSFENNFDKLKNTINNHRNSIELEQQDINSIYELLLSNKDIFVKFLENPYLTEHDTFTDLLQAVSHLYHEIRFRKNNNAFSEADMIHLREDAQRVYKYLSEEWLVYMDYIQNEYPFAYNLAIQNVPFAEIKQK
ncbi:MAG: hypothetical protein Q8936_20025 [Bacillota bacterium]|nr:hypothetical protein [Bacillota bacterium]